MRIRKENIRTGYQLWCRVPGSRLLQSLDSGPAGGARDYGAVRGQRAAVTLRRDADGDHAGSGRLDAQTASFGSSSGVRSQYVSANSAS